MKPRDRILTACRRKVPDRVPWLLMFTPLKFSEFRRRTGANNPADYFDFDIRNARIKPTRLRTDFSSYLGPPPGAHQWQWLSADYTAPPSPSVNEWGIGIIPGSSGLGYYDYVHPLRNMSSPDELDDYPFPDVTAEYRWEGLEETVAYWHQKGYAVGASVGHYNATLFEPAHLLRGFENMLCDFLINPDFAAALLDRINSWAVTNAIRLARAGVDIFFTGDDVGTERGMLISPRMWREWLKPRIAEMNTAARKAKNDLLIHFHSDGDIRPIIPDLIEIGVDILNPVQPECMDPAWVKREYGNHLAFWGTIGTQTTMPFGTPEEVRAVVKERIETLGQGGGLVLAPTHVLESDVPWENIMAFVEAVEEYGWYS